MPTIKAKLVRETAAAVFIQQEGDKPVWIPRSQCEYLKISGGQGFNNLDIVQDIELRIPAWLSKEKNLFEE